MGAMAKGEKSASNGFELENTNSSRNKTNDYTSFALSV